MERKAVKRNSAEHDCIIIGGGLAGLTCALALVNQGKKVCIFEKGAKVGGYQSYFKRKGFFFDSCLHSVSETHEGGPLLTTLGSLGLKELPRFIKLDPSFCFVFPDKTYAVPPDLNDYKSLLKDEFPQDASGIDGIFDTMGHIYEGLSALPDMVPAVEQYVGAVFRDLLDEYVSDRRLQAVISGFWGYLGLPPSKASALVLSAFNGSICSHGNYLPEKSISHTVDLLKETILEKGGEIHVRTPVKKVVIKDRRAIGVLLENGDTIYARDIVSNIDATTTFFRMIGEEHLQEDYKDQLKGLKPTLSAFSVYLGVKGGDLIPDNLSVANLIYPGDDLDRQYQAILRGEIEDMPFVISIPTFVNKALAPTGHHILSLFTAIPYRLEGMVDWHEKKAEYTDRLINQAEKFIPGLTRNIVVKEAATPDTLFRYTGNREGAVGGWDYTTESIINRPGNKTPIKGLWLTGHWTAPGVGVHGTIQSGCLTASLISEDRNL